MCKYLRLYVNECAYMCVVFRRCLFPVDKPKWWADLFLCENGITEPFTGSENDVGKVGAGADRSILLIIFIDCSKLISCKIAKTGKMRTLFLELYSLFTTLIKSFIYSNFRKWKIVC